jgi:hypothetical protein
MQNLLHRKLSFERSDLVQEKLILHALTYETATAQKIGGEFAEIQLLNTSVKNVAGYLKKSSG